MPEISEVTHIRIIDKDFSRFPGCVRLPSTIYSLNTFTRSSNEINFMVGSQDLLINVRLT